MINAEIGNIITESQKLADVKDARVALRTGVAEEVYSALKDGSIFDGEAAVKVMAYLLEVLTTRYGIRMNKKQSRPIPHLDSYMALREGTATAGEYLDVLAYINAHIQELRKKKVTYGYRPVLPTPAFFPSQKKESKKKAKTGKGKTRITRSDKPSLHNVSEMSEEQFEWFRWFKQGAGLDLDGIPPDQIISTAMTLDLSAFDNETVNSKNHAILCKCIQIRKSRKKKNKKSPRTRKAYESPQRTQKKWKVVLARM